MTCIVRPQMRPAPTKACRSSYRQDSLALHRRRDWRDGRFKNEHAPQGRRHVRDSRSPDAFDRQPDQNPGCSHHRRRAGVLRLLPDRLRARLPDRAVETHLRSVGNRADEFRNRRDHRRLCLGLACRSDRAAHRVHRHGPELLDRNGLALFHSRKWLDLSGGAAFLRRHRRRRTVLRGSAAGAGIHALLQTRLGWRSRDLRHSARCRLGCRDGRPRRRRRLAIAVRDRRAAGVPGAFGSSLGAGIAALAVPPGPLRGRPQVARLGAAGGTLRPAAADRG